MASELPPGRKASKKVFDAVMQTFRRGKLRSSSGKTVTDIKQALAIAQSEARAAMRRGASVRTWRGRTRWRAKLKRRD